MVELVDAEPIKEAWGGPERRSRPRPVPVSEVFALAIVSADEFEELVRAVARAPAVARPS